MQFLHSQSAFIDTPIDGRSDGQRAADNRAHACEEPGEALSTGFAVDDFHWGDVLLGC